MNNIIELLVKETAPEGVELTVTEGAKAGKVTVQENIIKGVHLVGFQAQNVVKPNTQPYKYTEEALKDAQPLYENADVYVGHAKGNDDRNPLDKVGYVTNAVFKEGIGLVGDIVLNAKHIAYESVLWWAKNKPEKLAMSHVARTFYAAKENAMTKISKVYSVDFVSNGSTTQNGLIGMLSKEGVITDKIEAEKWLSILLDTFYSCHYEAMYPLGKTLTQEERAVRLAPVIKDLLDEVSKLIPKTGTSTEATPVIKKDKTMEFVDITLDTLTKNRKDLVDAIALKAVESHTQTEQAVAEALAQVPEDARSDIFKRLVREAVVAGDEKTLTALVEDRKTLVAKTVVEAAPASHGTKTKPPTKTDDKPLDVATVGALFKKKP